MCSNRITCLVPRPLSLLVVQAYVGSIVHDNASCIDASQLSVHMCAADFPTQKQAAVFLESHNTHCDCNIARKQEMSRLLEYLSRVKYVSFEHQVKLDAYMQR